MKKICCLAISFCSLVAVNAQTQQQKQVKATLLSLMGKEHIPGLAYAVVQNGKVQTMGGLGKANLAYNEEVTTKTAFQTASCSKIFTTLLLGRLFDAGVLTPEQTLGSLLDSIPYTWKPITIKQLAAHQSGIKMADWSKATTSKAAMRLAAEMPMEYEPGTRDGYISGDYWVLQHVIEKQTGLRYFDALRTYVLQPLGLQNTYVNNVRTGFITDIDIIPELAQEYHWFDKDSCYRISQMWFTPTGYTAGGIYTSIEDMVKVATIFDRDDFLSKKTKMLLTNPVQLTSGKPGSYGPGLIVRPDYQGHKIIEHSGGPALADFVRFDKEKLTFIVLTNNRGLYPYLAKTIAMTYIVGLEPPTVPR